MNDRKIRILATAGTLSAAIFLLTAFIRVPIPAGYLHLGDAGVFLCAMLLSPGIGALCAGVGSALADLYGFPVYAPITFLIKGAAALVFALLWRKLPGKFRYLAFLAVLIVPIGYFLFELILFRNAAWADLPLNLLQAVVGAGLALLLDHASDGRFRV